MNQKRFLNFSRWLLSILTLSLTLVSTAHAGELTFGGFSQLNYTVGKNKTPNKLNTNTFSQGGIDLYLTKSLDEKTNMLAEIVFEISEANEAILDPERIWIQHKFHDLFLLKAGRVHTALGYWNESFHHGSWLQTSASRPSVFSFEDDGGILPVHAIGFEFRGEKEVGPGTISYVANLSNGRGVNPDPPQSGKDSDQKKAYNILVFYKINSFRFGGLFLKDSIAETAAFTDSTGATVDRAGFDETITGAHFVWNNGSTEVLSEYFNIDHKYDSKTLSTLAEKNNKISAYYVQVSHNIKKFTPYFRYESLKSDKTKGDVYLNIAANRKDTSTLYGLRYDLTYTSAFKVEYLDKTVNTAGSKAKTATQTFSWSYAW